MILTSHNIFGDLNYFKLFYEVEYFFIYIYINILIYKIYMIYIYYIYNIYINCHRDEFNDI